MNAHIIPPKRVNLTVHPAYVTGPIDPRLYGSFIEHLGRAVYTGIYEPGHPTANIQGFRLDVADLTRELGTTLVRYPGGNFVSNYNWEDGVGPQAERPRRVDLAWRSLETNQVGTDEFVDWCRLVDVEPMFAVNLGSHGISEAANWVEYCNLPGGTALSERRRANGHDLPHGIKLWCLGNEMDGPWQIGHKTAGEYGDIASQAAQAMSRVDPSLEFIVCGSSSPDMSTFGEWERIVLERTFNQADYLSLHLYVQEQDGDRQSFLASGERLDRFIKEIIATADSVAAAKRSTKRIKLSLDEWNVWNQDDFAGEDSIEEILEAPRLLENRYSALDAVVVGDMMATIIRNADRVAIACLAQLVNAIAPIVTEPAGDAWRQTTFYPLSLIAKYAIGVSLEHRLTAEPLTTLKHGKVDPIGVASILNDDGTLIFILTNRTVEPLLLEIDHAGFGERELLEMVTMLADNGGARRDSAAAETATPTVVTDVLVGANQTELVLPAESWSLLRLAKAGLA